MSPRTLRLELGPSLPLASAIAAAHAGAGACAALVLPGLPGIALGIALAALGLATAWSRALHRSGSSVRAIELDGPRMQVLLRSGESLAADAGERRYVGRLVVTLPLRRPVRRTLLITADMLPGDLFRRLRIWAMWGRLPVAAKQLPA